MKAGPENRKPKPLAFRWIEAVRDYAPKDWPTGMKAVLFSLGTYLDNKSGTWIVGQDKIASGANISREKAGAHLRRAEREGWLKTWKRKGRGQAWACHQYQAIIPPEIDALMKLKGRDETSQPSERDSEKGRDLTREGRDETPEKVETSGPTYSPYSYHSNNSGDDLKKTEALLLGLIREHMRLGEESNQKDREILRKFLTAERASPDALERMIIGIRRVAESGVIDFLKPGDSIGMAIFVKAEWAGKTARAHAEEWYHKVEKDKAA